MLRNQLHLLVAIATSNAFLGFCLIPTQWQLDPALLPVQSLREKPSNPTIGFFNSGELLANGWKVF